MSRVSLYQEKYEHVANEFWKLQKMEQTDQEKEYAELCQQLESMLVQYRAELEELEQENERLQKELEEMADVKGTYQALKEEEDYLLQLRAGLEKFSKR